MSQGKTAAMQRFDDALFLVLDKETGSKLCKPCAKKRHDRCIEQKALALTGPIMTAQDAADASVLYHGCECECWQA